MFSDSALEVLWDKANRKIVETPKKENAVKSEPVCLGKQNHSSRMIRPAKEQRSWNTHVSI